MSQIRVIRFARIDAGAPASTAGAVAVARVFIDESANPAGLILRRNDAWDYQLADGSRPELTSTESRQELEWQITLFHRGPIPTVESTAATPGETPTPLQLAG